MKFASGLMGAVALVLSASCGGGQEGTADLQKDERASGELSSSCAGVMPAAAPSSWTRSYGGIGAVLCGQNTSDASGNAILEIKKGSEFLASELFGWEIFTAAGASRGTGGDGNSRGLFPQEWGLQTLGDTNLCTLDFACDPGFALRAWTANGTLIRSTTPTFDVWDAENDLGGGVALVGLRPQQPFTIVTERFDAHSSPRAFQAVVARGTTQPTFIATGVSLSGLSLVLWNGEFSGFPANSIVGRWVDRFGLCVTGTFLVARNVSFASIRTGGVSATPLVDGSMAIRAHPAGTPTAQAWVAVVPGGSNAVSAVPGWLATRPDARLFIVRGGMAYALVFPVDKSTCSSIHFELFATAGNQCGSLDLEVGGPMQPGDGCLMDGNIGLDGTVIVGGAPLFEGPPSCRDRVFPALLR